MNYSIALEKQLQCLDFWVAGPGRAFYSGNEGDGMGWSVAVEGDIRQATGREMMDSLFGLLSSAEPYFISTSVATIALDAATDIPRWSLSKDTLPSRAGFAWFESPVNVPDWMDDEAAPLMALGWAPLNKNKQFPAGGISMTQFASMKDVPVPVATTVLPWGFGQSWRDAHDGGLRGNTEDGLRTPWRTEMKWRFAASLFAFIEQEIVSRSRQKAPRHVRRRLASRVDDVPLINVVTLRRKHPKHTETTTNPQPVDWQCQWFVRGHWRQQWYPSRDCHQAKYVQPYVKGPEDKPLREPRSRLFAVVR